MCVLVSNEYRHETNLGSTHTARPGVELPVNVQTNGLELNCDSSSCSFINAVLNAVGAKVTEIST